MKAVRAGHYCTAKFLISKGANVNKATTNNDHTPLSLACAGGHLAIVELLLQNKADPYHKLKVILTFFIQKELMCEFSNQFQSNIQIESNWMP